MSTPSEGFLEAKKVIRGPTHVTEALNLLEGMTYRLYIPGITVLFSVSSKNLEKGAVKASIISVKGDDQQLKAGTTKEWELSYLGLAPVMVAGQNRWYPHWIETAVDAFPRNTDRYTANPTKFPVKYEGMTLECFSDNYITCDITGFSIDTNKISCGSWKMWAPELGKWYQVQEMPKELIFSDAILYQDGRMAVKCESYWVILNPKRG